MQYASCICIYVNVYISICEGIQTYIRVYIYKYIYKYIYIYIHVYKKLIKKKKDVIEGDVLLSLQNNLVSFVGRGGSVAGTSLADYANN